MYTIKQIPQDFIVTEISNVKLEKQGRFTYIKLTKTGRNTLHVISQIARILHLKEAKIGFAGSKDKHAVTQQLISIQGRSKEKIESLDIENTTLKVIGFGNNPISLGDLQGNQFTITIRNSDKTILKPITHVENYFDDQRFGSHNLEIGTNLIKKDFAKAASLIRRAEVIRHLDNKPKDYIGAIRKVPLRLLRMYVNSYQSFIFNETLSRYLTTQPDTTQDSYSQGTLIFTQKPQLDLQIPLIGFRINQSNNEQINAILKNIMIQENIRPKDFIIRQVPQISLEGELRSAYIPIADFSCKTEPDEINQNKNKLVVSFSLPKGSYATMVVRKLMKC